MSMLKGLDRVQHVCYDGASVGYRWRWFVTEETGFPILQAPDGQLWIAGPCVRINLAGWTVTLAPVEAREWPAVDHAACLFAWQAANGI